MRPAFVVGVVGPDDLSPEQQPALARRLALCLRFLRYGARERDPESSEGASLHASLAAALDDPLLARELESWRGLRRAELAVVAECGTPAERLASEVIAELRRSDAGVRLRRQVVRTAPIRALARQSGPRLARALEELRAEGEQAESWLARLPDDPHEEEALDARAEADLAEPARRAARELAASVELLHHSQLLIALGVPDERGSRGERAAAAWISGGALECGSRAAGGRGALLPARGPLLVLPTSATNGESAPLCLLLDPLDAARARAAAGRGDTGPAAVETRERRTASLRSFLRDTERLAAFAELPPWDTAVATDAARAAFLEQLDRSPRDAAELESELRAAGHTALVVDLKAFAHLRCEVERASRDREPRLEPQRLWPAFAAAALLNLFALPALAPLARALCGALGIAFAALAYFRWRAATCGERRDRGRELRFVAEALRVQAAWAASGCAEGVDEPLTLRNSATFAPLNAWVRAAAAPLPRFERSFAQLAPTLRTRVLGGVVRAWVEAGERRYARAAAAHRARSTRWSTRAGIALATGLAVWGACALQLAAGSTSLDARGPLVLLALAVFGAWLAPQASDLGLASPAGALRALGGAKKALPIAAVLMVLALLLGADGREALALALAFGGTALAMALLGYAALPALLGGEPRSTLEALAELHRRTRLRAEELVARLERELRLGDLGAAEASTAELQALFLALGRELLDERADVLARQREHAARD